MFQPVRIGSLDLVNRVVVSPMDMYVAVDGLASDFHLVHLGGKALGGAGLVMTEMVCVSPEGRITPGCAGLWDDEQQASFRRVTDFVHTNTSARIGLQLGHSGGKGSTKLMWEGIDEPLRRGQLGGRRPLARALPRGRQPGAPRAHPVGDGHHPRPVRRVRASRRRGGLRPARAALRPRLPALGVPLSRHQPAHRRLRRRRRRAAALPARGVRRHPRGVARGPADDGADLGHRLGRRRSDPRRRADRRAGVRRRRRRGHRRVHRPGDLARAAGVRHGPTRRRTPTRSATDSACRPSPSA